jgi:hypothetical protein
MNGDRAILGDRSVDQGEKMHDRAVDATVGEQSHEV